MFNAIFAASKAIIKYLLLNISFLFQLLLDLILYKIYFKNIFLIEDKCYGLKTSYFLKMKQCFYGQIRISNNLFFNNNYQHILPSLKITFLLIFSENIIVFKKNRSKFLFNFFFKKKIMIGNLINNEKLQMIKFKPNFYIKNNLIDISNYKKFILSNRQTFNIISKLYSVDNKKKIFFNCRPHKNSYQKLKSITGIINKPYVNNILLNPLKFKAKLINNIKFKKVFLKFNEDVFVAQNKKQFFFMTYFNNSRLNLPYLIDKLIYILNGANYLRYGVFTNKPRVISYEYFFYKSYNKAIVSTSKYLSNYFHYLFEIIIPNYYLSKKFKNVKIILPTVFNNFNNSLKKIYGKKLIVTQNDNSLIKIDDLISGNFVNRIENFYPQFEKKLDSKFYINKKAIIEFSKDIKKKFKIKKNFSKKTLFIAREESSNNKNPLGLNNLIKLIKRKKNLYKKSDLTVLDFVKQVQLFSRHKKIIIPIGSALANIIFCEKNTKIFVLCPDYKFTFFHFWKYIADILNLDIRYVCFKSHNKKFLFAQHSNYIIEPLKLLDEINRN